jgi:hypothetical protein
MDLSFNLSVAPGLLKASDYGCTITSYARRETTEFFDARGCRRL